MEIVQMKTQDSSWYCIVDGIVYPQFVTDFFNLN